MSYGCKGGQEWLLDTNALWRGASSSRRKVVPLMLPTLVTHALRIFVCVAVGRWVYAFVCHCGYSWDQRFFWRQTALTSVDTHTQHRLISVKTLKARGHFGTSLWVEGRTRTRKKSSLNLTCTSDAGLYYVQKILTLEDITSKVRVVRIYLQCFFSERQDKYVRCEK